jgi:signal transduction histidine kinase
MLDDLGLLAALHWLFQNYHTQTGEVVEFVSSGLDQRFSPDIEITAYRITQEALTNIIRHSQSKQVHVNAWADRHSLNLQIADRGVGFDPPTRLSGHASSGLSGLRERARLLGGDLIIESAPGAGTSLSVRLPLFLIAEGEKDF